ncbi:hypothetical protein A3D78_05785 [Candidatus Gottesmanbacteria bacterium RIFCSPHIGHO2_02_FULL_39_14]|uniref:HEPN AbiU2-like domain-containing protein n=1 Tax=Candidatus Gottesmanbacteria bacterium RIFCSPHIGHO2_02_FULL_39_14 TaxID=1798383 RepID=A0A1F6A2N6_9BACT|nr:MAG: hypothetical protein A3D78_05785 [Candidatus Gottesmanbacteria bacterium RIFCSPHIGHO2_02_FULL_39_14]
MDKVKKWQKEIEVITGDVEDLLYSKYQAEELEKIIRANPFVQQNISSFWEHYKLNYTYFIVSKIWHQIDEDTRSLSLINLLKDLLTNHRVITKSWWVSQGSNALSSSTFEEEFGKGDNLDLNLVCEDIQSLKDSTKEIKEFRHKQVGHKDNSGKFTSNISYTKIKEAIGQIEKLVIKYQLLLTQSGYESLTPVPDDWQVAFTKGWINNEK